MATYITGITALNIVLPGREMADWHSFVVSDRHNWCIAGQQFASTDYLLGDQDLHDATELLRREHASDAPEGTFVASYERAVFDLLHEFVVVWQEPVPNIQARDIDDVVDFEKVAGWIKSVDLPRDRKEAMLAWLANSDYW